MEDERGVVLNAVDADLLDRAIAGCGDYVGRTSLVADITGDTAVIVELATYEEVLLAFDFVPGAYMLYDIEGLDRLIKKLKKARRRILKRA